MKKIVIAMLLILPLIIVATVLVATDVISNEVYIAVEGVTLNVDTSQTIEIGLSEETFQLKATVYPSGARNTNVIWSLENVQSFGEETAEPATIDDGLVSFSTYCTFDAVVTTEEGGKSARVNFYVKCDTLNGVSIDNGGASTLTTGESKRFRAVYDPVDAEVSEVIWESSAPEIAAVDANGIVTAIGVGRADIKVSAEEFTSSVTVTVTAGATKFGERFSVSADSFALADISPSGETTVVRGGRLENGVFVFTSDEAVLSIDGTYVFVTRCDRDDIVISHKLLLTEEELKIGKLPLYLTAVYADAFRTDKPEVTFTASPENMVSIKDGCVTPLRNGKAVITADSGVSNDSLTLEIVRPVTYIRLSEIDADDKKGIASETVYGTSEYQNGELTNYKIPFSIQYPSGADWSDFIVTVSDEKFAVFDGNTLTVIGDAPERKTLTVTVTARYSAFESMDAVTRRNFVFLDGVNCDSYEEIVTAASEGHNVMMSEKVTVPIGADTITLRSDFYGNGYMLDAIKMTKAESTTPVFEIEKGGVTVSNAYVRADNAVNINEANGLSGTAIKIGDAENEFIEDVRVEYSILENCYYGIYSERAEYVVDGCIVRNTSNFGIFVVNDKNDNGDYVYSNVTVNNTIMSNIVATAVGISSASDEADGSALRTQSTFTQTGFLDIYNWQDVTSMRMLDRELIPDNPAADEMIKRFANSAIASEIKKDDYAALRVEKDGVIYINLGIVTAGATHACTTVPTFEDERFITFPISVLDTLNNITKPFGFTMQPCVLYLYDNTADITPDSTFAEDAATYARLRGE